MARLRAWVLGEEGERADDEQGDREGRKREGKHVTLVTWASPVYEALDAAVEVAKTDGIEVEVIDLRSIQPLDTANTEDAYKRNRRIELKLTER